MKICPRCQGTFEEGIAYCPKDGGRLTTYSKMAASGATTPGASPLEPPLEDPEDYVEDLTGRTIAGRYSILRRLGEGGMGVVYAAVDTRLEKQVAVKVLKEDFARRQDVVARFTQEAKSAARIKHENVLDVTDYGQTEDGSFYIAMELLLGKDLADVLQKDGTVAPDRAMTVAIQVCRALGAAHAKGIVHRDMKPENIFLVPSDDDREVVKIVDFGIAQMKDLSGGGATETSRKLTRTGMIFGTPEYMSPEQAAGKQIDHRVDVYATGVILYEMLAGRVPFVGDTFMGVLTQHMFEQPPPIKSIRPDSTVTPELEAVIHKALSKDPTLRYQSMQELADDLALLRDGRQPGANITGGVAMLGGSMRQSMAGIGPISDPMVAPPAQQGSSRRTVFILGGALLLVGAIGAVAMARGQLGRGGGSEVHTTASNAPATTPGGGTGAGANNAGDPGGGHTPTTPLGLVPAAVTDAGTGSTATGSVPSVIPALPPAPVEPATIRVRVLATPVTARVEVDGQPTISCASTPCDLSLARGTQVRLRATAPHKRGDLLVVPDHDGQEVSIAMAAVPDRPSGNGNTGRPRPEPGGANARGGRCLPGQMTRIDPGTHLRVPCVFDEHH